MQRDLPYIKSILVLENGDYYYGRSFSNICDSGAEICFVTGMTGYQEILTDPSYSKQIIVFTAPHIGNVGVNIDDNESIKPSISGVVFGESITDSSNYRSKKDFIPWLLEHKIPHIVGVDTRTLVRSISNSNKAIKGVVAEIDSSISINFFIKKLQHKAQKSKSLSGYDVSKIVSTQYKYIHDNTDVEWGNAIHSSNQFIKIAVIDYGLKKNMLRSLSSRGASVIVFPRDISFHELMSVAPNAVLLSSGPGDPSALHEDELLIIRQITDSEIPVMGICFGYQLLARACGANLKQMPCGHHGINHPVQDLVSKKVLITSQNHEFVVDDENLPDQIDVTHRSLFDHTLAGFKVKDKNIFAYQFHPEACPGPNDAKYLFDNFLEIVRCYAKKN